MFPGKSSRGVELILLSNTLLILFGCGPTGPQGGPRVGTIPVTGIVHVDGQPASFLRVVAVPAEGKSAVPMESASITSNIGEFSLSTYETGDGVPEGNYKLIFTWGQINLMNGQYSGDKLNGKFADPSKSEFSLTVTAGSEPQNLGIIELSAN